MLVALFRILAGGCAALLAVILFIAPADPALFHWIGVAGLGCMFVVMLFMFFMALAYRWES